MKQNTLITLIVSFFVIHAGISQAQSTSIYIDPSGKVGIGTSTPSEKLSVAGSMQVDADLTAKGSMVIEKNLSVKGSMDITENLNVTGTHTGRVAHFLGGQNQYMEQGLYLNWNKSGGGGETNFINNSGLGPGGFQFLNKNKDGIGETPSFTIAPDGAVQTPKSLRADGETFLYNGEIHVLRHDANFTYLYPWGTGKKGNTLTVGGGTNTNFKVTGNLGVGDDADYPLDVRVEVIPPNRTWDKEFEGNPKNGKGQGSNIKPISIRSSGGILAGYGVYISSDERIKKSLVVADTYKDLSLLNQLKVTSYQYKDARVYGTGVTKGFIAQEVEKVYPQAINSSADFIPDVYAMANENSLSNHTLTLSLKQPHHLISGDQVKLITEKDGTRDVTVSVLNENTFTVSNWDYAGDHIFVVGKKVKDFRSVDYQQIFALGISSIQQLSKELASAKEENELLKAEIKKTNEAVQKQIALLNIRMDKAATLN